MTHDQLTHSDLERISETYEQSWRIDRKPEESNQNSTLFLGEPQ